MSVSMNTCDRCGSAVRPTASFCPNCGAPLGNVSAASGEGQAAGEASAETRRSEPRTSASDDPALDYSFPVGSSSMDTQPDRPEPSGSPFDLPPASGLPPMGEIPSASGPDVFSTPPAAAAGVGGVRSRLPLIIGCCAGALLLGCLLAVGLGWSFFGQLNSF